MSHTDWGPRTLVVVGILLAGLSLMACNGPTPTESPIPTPIGSPTAGPVASPTPVPTQDPTAIAPVTIEPPAQIRRELPIVRTGPDRNSLPTLEDFDWHDLLAGSWVSTDTEGEGVVRINGCRIYIFFLSELLTSPCPKADLLGGGTYCSTEGASAYINECDPKIAFQTGSAQVQGGDWLALIYLPDEQVSVVLVLEGQAAVEPVLDADARSLGDPDDVPPGYFWFRTAGATSQPIGGLEPGMSHHLREMPRLIEGLPDEKKSDMRRWLNGIRRRARSDGIRGSDQICSPPNGWRANTVRANDTLSSLAAETGTSVEMIRWANDCREDDVLGIGDRLYLPTRLPTHTPTATSPPPTPTPTPPPPTPTPTTPIPPTPPTPPTEIPVDLIIDKTGPAEVGASQPYSYTVTVTNAGPSEAQNVTVVDDLPVGVLNVSATGCNNVPACEDFTCVCELGTIAAGAFRSFTVNVTAPSEPMTVTNIAEVRAGLLASNPVLDDDTVETVVKPLADLEIQKTDSADPVSPGQEYSYTVTVTNTGPSLAQGVMVTDSLPSGVNFVSSDSCNDESERVLICELGDIAADGSKSFTINVKARDERLNDRITPCIGQEISNEAEVTSSTEDPDPLENNRAHEPTTITLPPDLKIEKIDSADSVLVSQRYSYTVTVTNEGRCDAQNVTVTDTLPGGVTFNPSDRCNSEPDGVLTCDLGTVLGKTSSSFTINVTAPITPGVITNTARVTSSAVPGDDDDNEVEETTTVNPRPPLFISKDNGTDKLMRGQSTTYTIVVSNTGSAEVRGAKVTDDFPDDALTNVRWTCASSAGAACSPSGSSGSGDIDHSVDIPAGGFVTYTVHADVHKCATSPLTNTVTVTIPASLENEEPFVFSATDSDTLPDRPILVDAILWILQILLAILFLAFGVRKLMRPQAGRRSV